jgi:hypothetical protein
LPISWQARLRRGDGERLTRYDSLTRRYHEEMYRRRGSWRVCSEVCSDGVDEYLDEDDVPTPLSLTPYSNMMINNLPTYKKKRERKEKKK